MEKDTSVFWLSFLAFLREQASAPRHGVIKGHKSLARGGKDDISLCYGDRSDDPMLIQRDPRHCWHGAQVSGAQVGDLFKTGTTVNWVALAALAGALGIAGYFTARSDYTTTSVVMILVAVLVAIGTYMSFMKTRAQ